MFITDEMREKARQTKLNNLPQIALPEETETHINVDYYDKIIYIDTCKATVMNRLERKGIKYDKQETLDGRVFNRKYKIPFSDMSKFISATLFK